MYKRLELTETQMFAMFHSMGAIKQITDPDTITEVNLNFQTARDGLQQLAYNKRAMAEDDTILLPTILDLILYDIDLTYLPDLVSDEIRSEIPITLIRT